MTVSTLTPNGSTAGDYTVTGAASAHAALSDGSDASYIRRTSTTATATATIRFSTVAVTANQLVKQVRLRARCQTPDAASRMAFSLFNVSSGLTYVGSAYSRKGVRALATYEGPWLAVPPSGGTWNQTAIDSVGIQVTDYAATSAARGYTYELFVDVDVYNRPTVSVSAPTGTTTSTSTPTVSWTFTDVDGDSQSHYEIKVFSAAQYGAAGFNPDTSTATWASGEVTSSLASVDVGTFLANGTYRAYVKAAKLVSTTKFYSAWAYSSFVQAVAAPEVPVLTVSYLSGLGQVAISVQGAAATGFDSQEYEVQRSTDRAAWATVRGGGSVVPNAAGLASLTDAEAVRGTRNFYRVRVTGYISGVAFTSAWHEGSVAFPGVASNHLSIPDAAGLEITGDIEFVARVALTDWTPAADQYVVAKYYTPTPQRAYAFGVSSATSGRLFVRNSTDGTTSIYRQSDSAPSFVDGRAYWIKATLDVNLGGTQNATAFYWAADQDSEPVTWTTLGATVTTTSPVTTTTSIFGTGTSDVVLGSLYAGSTPATMRLLRVIVRNGIGGTTVLDVEPVAVTDSAAATFSATTGGTVTVARSGGSPLTIATPSVDVPNDGQWWFKPLSNLDATVAGVRVQHGFSSTIDEGAGVFYPIGRGSAVVVSSGDRGGSGTYEIVTTTQAEFVAFEPVLAHRGVVLVQDPLGTAKYVRFVSRDVSMTGTAATPARRIAVKYVEATEA